ncbi:MAG: hypothetical protein LKE41_09695 [Prevotella sp.]|jgi:hypothetical protein|nr:hypothetical protein [Prevotella sp.]
MKKSSKLLFLFCVSALLLTFSGCKPKLKNIRGVVTGVVVKDDTLRSFTLQCGEDSMVFNVDSARFTEGMMLPRDSVIVDYIKDKSDTLKAYVVTVLPKPIKEVDLKSDSTKKLLTIPQDKLKKSIEESKVK